jgi:hypothetical protein
VAADPFSQPYTPPAGMLIDTDDLEDLGDIEISDEEDDAIRTATAQVEADIASRTLSIRLTTEQTAMLERIADVFGVSVHAYVRQAVLRQAINDTLRAQTGGLLPRTQLTSQPS